MLAWVKRALAWLATHPWPIVAALGATVAALLFRRKAPTLTDRDLEVAARTARAEVEAERAAKLNAAATHVQAQIDAEEIEIDEVETPTEEEIRNAPDKDVADLFSRSGL